MTMTPTETQDEIDHLRARVAELEGQVKGLEFALKHQSFPEPLPYPMTPAEPWVWPSPVKATWTVVANTPTL